MTNNDNNCDYNPNDDDTVIIQATAPLPHNYESHISLLPPRRTAAGCNRYYRTFVIVAGTNRDATTNTGMQAHP